MLAVLLPDHDRHPFQEDDDGNLGPQDDDDDRAAQDDAEQQRGHDGAGELPLPDVDVHGQAAEHCGVSDAV
ncbi:hypothetical protein HO173_008662 [Letharia columbiana]|uniref:Uncharacterized protein n=1 Tax=Letharia columbiana TaxID=112416 RepID=A0A8H6FR17_9LECA|nr:uncharacterized protein HO173_008662 [Letharia columbiana]KAF6233118.1 hypothetical protein HO173_008662 [Letharia columbiana]